VTSNHDAGPPAANEVFQALIRMSDTDLIAMSGFWTGGDADMRKQAWLKVRDVPRDDPREKELGEARDQLARWVNDVGVSWYGANERSIVVPSGADQGNLRRNAVPAILDALAASLFADLLDDDERDELLEPFRQVTEPHEEPADD
jgi:hypothetical protein